MEGRRPKVVHGTVSLLLSSLRAASDVRHAATQSHACRHPKPALSIPRGPALGFVPSCTLRGIAVPSFELPLQCVDNRDASGIAGTDTAHTRGATPARRTGWKAAAEATAAVKTAARVNIVACVGAVHCLLGITRWKLVRWGAKPWEQN